MPSMTCSRPAGGQRAALAEDQDAVAEAHDRRDRGDLRGTGQRLLGLGVDLAEHDVVVLVARLLVGRRELAARAAPRGPPVDEHDVARRDGLLEGVGGELDGGHAGCSSVGVWVGPPEGPRHPEMGATVRCGQVWNARTAHIIPIRHDGDVPHTLTAALDAVLDGMSADSLRGATASLRRRLPQRGTAHPAGAARPHHRRGLRGLPDAGHARRRRARPAPCHRPRPRPRGGLARRHRWGHGCGELGRGRGVPGPRARRGARRVGRRPGPRGADRAARAGSDRLGHLDPAPPRLPPSPCPRPTWPS